MSKTMDEGAKYLHYKDGWHDYNPNDIVCEKCGRSNVEFLWRKGEVVGFRCNSCKAVSLDK